MIILLVHCRLSFQMKDVVVRQRRLSYRIWDTAGQERVRNNVHYL